MRYPLVSIFLIPCALLHAGIDETASPPKTEPPVFGTAFVSDLGNDLPIDQYGLLWELTVRIPEVDHLPVSDLNVSDLPTKLQGESEKVTTRVKEYRLQHMSQDQRVQPLVTNLEGKTLSREEVIGRLRKETPVLVSLRAERPDAYYLQHAKPDTLVVIFGPVDHSDFLELQNPAQENSESVEPVKSGPADPSNMDKPPVFALAQATTGLSRDFGLDGPHLLTYITLSSPSLKWTEKGRTRDWKFSQPAPDNLTSITLFLGGPTRYWEEQSRFMKANGEEVEGMELVEQLAKPTTIVVSISGQSVPESVRRRLKSDTIILVLGRRDLNLKPKLFELEDSRQ